MAVAEYVGHLREEHNKDCITAKFTARAATLHSSLPARSHVVKSGTDVK